MTASASAQDIALPDPIPMGTTVGQRADRLLIRGATVISGRGTPRSNRAMPPEGPIDIVIENGRIVDMILRDPVMRAWSHYRYSVYLGNEVEPFDRALSLEYERLAHPIPEHDVVFSYRQRGRYIDHIERFMEYYPRSNLHILFLEELLEDPSRILGALLTFLGVTSSGAWRGQLIITNEAPLKSIRVAGELGDGRRRFWQRRLLQRLISSLQYCFSAKWRERIARKVEHRS